MFNFNGLTPGADGKSELEVCFSLDINGILLVSAEEVSTDHKKVANLSRPNSGDSGSSNSYVNALKNHKSVDHDSPAIVLDEDCALSKDLSSSLRVENKDSQSLTNLKNAS
ncbi:RNA-directed DNA polymerase, eukaryota [Tanacetum coccineum]